MDLEKLKDDWEALARNDALGAILTDHTKSGGKWQLDEFMATGESEVVTVMEHLRQIGHEPDFGGAALDFGCGVGRLTQALARRFASCTGVDISKEMVSQAERLNKYPHCRYVVNAESRLPFRDGEFAFIYCNIVLQHVPKRFAEEYLREFVRILGAGGILVFGVQDSFAMPDVASRVTRIRQILRAFADQACAWQQRGRDADALPAGGCRADCIGAERQSRRYSVDQYGGEGLQRKTHLSGAAAAIGLCGTAVLRFEGRLNEGSLRVG